MRGGIQNNTTATSESSAYLDGLIKEIFNELGVEYYRGISGEDLNRLSGNNILNRVQGTFPDGGIIYDKDMNPLLAIECKYNGRTGNAIERWFKNYNVCKYTIEVKRYVTFLLGEGFFDDNSPSRALATVSLYEDFKEHDIYKDNTGNFIQFYRYRNMDNLKEEVKKDVIKELENVGVRYNNE